MPRFGSEHAGFSVEQGTLSVRVRVWGSWGDDVAMAFPEAVCAAVSKCSSPIRLLFDARELRPQGNAVQAAFRKLMSDLSRRYVARALRLA